jgi:hypothetical protein
MITAIQYDDQSDKQNMYLRTYVYVPVCNFVPIKKQTNNKNQQRLYLSS